MDEDERVSQLVHHRQRIVQGEQHQERQREGVSGDLVSVRVHDLVEGHEPEQHDRHHDDLRQRGEQPAQSAPVGRADRTVRPPPLDGQ